MAKKKGIRKKSTRSLTAGRAAPICPRCSAAVRQRQETYESTKTSFHTGRPITIPDAVYFQCSSRKCGYSWVPAAQVARIEDLVFQESYQTLSSAQIRELRESYGVANKTAAARLLGLNEKAFVKLEKSGGRQNFSTDILIRLVAFRKENLDFLKELQRKSYRYDPDDYELVCRRRRIAWRHEIQAAPPAGYLVDGDGLNAGADRERLSLLPSVLGQSLGGGYGEAVIS